MIIRIFGLLLIVLSPFCMGLPWISLGGAKSTLGKICFAYVAGYFLRHTLFHLIAMPMTFMSMHFSAMANIFTVVLLIFCVFSALCGIKTVSWQKDSFKLTRINVLYLLFFLVLLAIQLYITIFMDPTYMAFDDASYTVYSSDALANNYMMETDPYTGVFTRINYRFIQSALLFPAYITRITGIPVTMVDRTFSYALNILMAYACYYYMAEDLYQNKENRQIFLIFVSLLYLFGYHSHYSMSFRLLGPNSQGKAVLAVIFVPLLYVLFRKGMEKPYDRSFGVLLLLLSDAACSLSLMGAGYMICITILLVILAIFRKISYRRCLLYILWGCSMPCVYICIYLFMKYYI